MACRINTGNVVISGQSAYKCSSSLSWHAEKENAERVSQKETAALSVISAAQKVALTHLRSLGG
jgi:hypothetical protein